MGTATAKSNNDTTSTSMIDPILIEDYRVI
jgi:hypothetical protein